MKKNLFLPIFLFLIIFNAFSLEKKRMEYPNIDAIVAKLQLDDVISTHLKALMEAHTEKLRVFREGKREQSEDMHSLHNQHRQELYSLLGADKMYEFENQMHKFHP